MLHGCGEWARNSLREKPGKIALVSNQKIFRLYGETVSKSLTEAGFEIFVCSIGDGERHKNLRTLQQTLGFLSENRISRTDAVVALGGGVVGDLAGFAASIYVRGVAFLQIPTTLLAMIDSSVGGKTGVNSEFGKNLIGTFYQPNGVLIDVETLETLPKRELTAGFCEAVKQGVISGKSLFDQTTCFLDTYPMNNLGKSLSSKTLNADLEDLLASHVTFKAEIVANDERESPGKTDARSRKILNFGHTFAHALEKVTNYRYLKHGEAVGHGIMFAVELSKELGLLGENEVSSVKKVVLRAGKLPLISHIDSELIFRTFNYDKKLINDSLQWILLKGVGKPFIFPHSEIPHAALVTAFKEITRHK